MSPWWLVPLGAAAGSAAALLAERLPRGEPVLRARSRCRACGTALGARDLIPIVSALALGGRCRHCRAPIPKALWQAEVAGLGLGALAAALAATPAEAAWSALWLWTLLALALADLRRFRLPDPLCAALLAFGFGLAWPDWPGAVLGAAAGAGAFAALALGYRWRVGRTGMGGGDVKLMAGLGAGLGWPALPAVALIAAGAALAVAALRAARRGRRLRRRGAVPFGAFLGAAGAVVWTLQRL
jgi:leader peptidase (prepilin peptidase)/N-methyltransferase